MDTVDVVVPVHRGLVATRRCLESVIASRSIVGSETIVIDDATPEAEIARYLDELAGDGRVTLLRNDANEGFVRSVNRGMALHRDRDVVLLNSDTEVAGDWLDRLRRSACADDDIGTVTPFSNNATICSYPFMDWSGGLPGTLGLAALDRLFAATNAGRSVDLPTGVGSCLYIRRACLDQVGLFDADRFGRGYGEENDFCLRALARGWRSVLAGDVFVFHEGAVSFALERSERMRAALAALLEIHPDYLDRVHAFVATDPIRPLRDAVDAARVTQSDARGASPPRRARPRNRASQVASRRRRGAGRGTRRRHCGAARRARPRRGRGSRARTRVRAAPDRDRQASRRPEPCGKTRNGPAGGACPHPRFARREDALALAPQEMSPNDLLIWLDHDPKDLR